jgi:hypothetical protein
MILELSTQIALTLMCATAGVIAMWLTTYLTSKEWAPWVAFLAVTILLIVGLYESSLLQR